MKEIVNKVWVCKAYGDFDPQKAQELISVINQGDTQKVEEVKKQLPPGWLERFYQWLKEGLNEMGNSEGGSPPWGGIV